MRTRILPILVCIATAALTFPISGQIARTRTSVAHSPYTAEYKIERNQRLADGNVINFESTETVTVDSQGRRMTATTETSISGDQTPSTRVFVFTQLRAPTWIGLFPPTRNGHCDA